MEMESKQKVAFFKPKVSKRSQPVDGPARDLASLISPEVADAALTARRRVQRLLASAQSAPLHYRAERIRIGVVHVSTTYLHAIDAIREAATPSDLAALQSTLVERLSRGYELAPNPTRNALWVRLLTEFEVVSDCLSENVIGRYLDRLQDLSRLSQ